MLLVDDIDPRDALRERKPTQAHVDLGNGDVCAHGDIVFRDCTGDSGNSLKNQLISVNDFLRPWTSAFALDGLAHNYFPYHV